MYSLAFTSASVPQWEYSSEPNAAAAPHSNFFKGVQWSPDGRFLLTCCDDSVLRVFNADVLGTPAGPSPSLRIPAGESVYDYAWFPGTDACDPGTCCLASTGRGHPVQLWDAFSGDLRASYVLYDAADAPTPAHSLAFSPDGGQLAAGLDRALCLFATGRPGRECVTLTTHARGRGGEGQPGILSTLSYSPCTPGLLAAGSYAGTSALYDARSGEALCVLRGAGGAGVSAVRFSADGNYLYAGSRGAGAAIACWDLRGETGVLYSIPRQPAEAATHQRMEFDIEPAGRHLVTGGQDGCIRWYDLCDGCEVSCSVAAGDTVNGVSIHPFLPILATASGQRRFPLLPDSDSEEEGEGSVSAESESGEDAAGEGCGVLGKQDHPAFRGLNALTTWLLDSKTLELPDGEHDMSGSGVEVA